MLVPACARKPLHWHVRFQSTVPLPRSHSESIETLRQKMKGQVPQHQSLLLLYTQTPTRQWPLDIGSVSPTYQDALFYQKEFQGKVLMCRTASKGFRENCPSLILTGASYQQEYPATFFAKLADPFYIPALKSSELNDWAKIFREKTQDGIDVANMLQNPRQARSLHRSSYKSQEYDKGKKLAKKIWIMVCTHAARDCRCGEHGSAVYTAFCEEIRARGLWERFNVCEVSHVGGHAYAANVLVYPHGEWYGTMRPEHVGSFVESLVDVEGPDSLSGPNSPLWRGSWFDHPGDSSQDRALKLKDASPEWGTDLDALSRSN